MEILFDEKLTLLSVQQYYAVAVELLSILRGYIFQLGIDAKSPVEFVEKAKSIINVHETLRMRTREEQELYNREYEMLQRNIEARKAEYEEIAIKLQREQGTILVGLDIHSPLVYENLLQTVNYSCEAVS